MPRIGANRKLPGWLAHPPATVRLLLGVLLLVLALSGSPVGQAIVGLWSCANLVLLAGVALWGLLRVRSLAPAFPASVRWALVVALVSTLLLDSEFATQVLQHLGHEPSFSFLLVLGVVMFAALFGVAVLCGLAGAALGIYARGAGTPSENAARAGTGWWWCVTILAVTLSDVAKPVLAEGTRGALVLSVPCAVWALLRTTRAERYSAILGTTSERLSRLLRTSGAGKRGLAVGTVAAALALGLASRPVFTGVRGRTLVSLIRFRNEAIIPHAFPVNLTAIRGQRGLEERRRIVLLHLDPVVRRKALTTGSECAIQAEVIRRLASWKPTRVALPAPRLDAAWPVGDASLADTTPPGAADVLRNLADLPRLAREVAAAGNTVLTLPQFLPAQADSPGGSAPAQGGTPARVLTPTTGKHLAVLAQAALDTADGELSWYGTLALPALPLHTLTDAKRADERSSAALALFEGTVAAQHGSAAMGERAISRAALRVPLIAPGLALVDYYGAEPGRDFPHVSYSAVLAGAPVYVTPPPDLHGHMPATGQWVQPAEFFRDKLVILDSLDSWMRDTPLGPMPTGEVLANAVATLMTGDSVRRAPTLWLGVGVLVLGAAVGRICAGRGPFQAGWRTGLIVLVLAVGFPVVFVFSGVWIDPIAPFLAVGGAFLLSGQINYAADLESRLRNRALLERFVAPQVVDELLDDWDNLGLGGRRCTRCILFADARDFTAFAQSHQPEQVIAVINHYMSAMTEELFRHEGILDKYTGDGLMAFFEVDDATSDGMLRAVRAALAMRDAAQSVSARLRLEGREPLEMGFGLDCGEVVVGLVGNPRQFSYTALGYAVVIAARLQSLARGGEVVVSDAVMERLGDLVHAAAGEPVFVKGVAREIRAHRILGLRAAGDIR